MQKMKTLIFTYFTLYYIQLSSAATGGNQKQQQNPNAHIIGVYPMDGTETVDGVARFPSHTRAQVFVFGARLSDSTKVGVCRYKDCMYVLPAELKVQENTEGSLAVLSLETPDSRKFWYYNTLLYICLKDPTIGNWTYQGSRDKVGFIVYDTLITPAVLVIIIILAYCLSSLMSGLNLGLMLYDLYELNLLKNSGNPKEKKYATYIVPLRRNGNFLLCSIVITLTLCNGISTVSVDKFVSSWVAVLLTTVILVIMCEILPQAVCSHYPLSVGYYTRYITRACMIITAPVSYPLSKLLNVVLGKEVQALYTKERLKELLKISKLPSDEQMIICGTLDLNKKTVEEVMTVLDDVFELPVEAMLDFETIALILSSGNSRIPIYVGNRSNIQHVLLVKDLALLDPDAKVPLKSLVQHSKYKCTYIRKGTSLDDVYVLFQKSRTHIAFVEDGRSTLYDGEKHVVGLITFEDVIEEIFQSEINDETDAFTDNRTMRRLSDITAANELRALVTTLRPTAKNKTPSDNLKTATQQFLATLVFFSPSIVSSAILSKLLNLEIYCNAPGNNSPNDKIVVRGSRCDAFLMVLEGLVEVKFKGEGLKFEAGAFRYFGIDALKTSEGFVPNYSIDAVKETEYIKITGVLYNAVVLATNHERTGKRPPLDRSSQLYKYFCQLSGRYSSSDKPFV